MDHVRKWDITGPICPFILSSFGVNGVLLTHCEAPKHVRRLRRRRRPRRAAARREVDTALPRATRRLTPKEMRQQGELISIYGRPTFEPCIPSSQPNDKGRKKRRDFIPCSKYVLCKNFLMQSKSQNRGSIGRACWQSHLRIIELLIPNRVWVV